MPLPKPNAMEKQDAFMERCMSADVMKAEHADMEERAAICMRQWNDKDKKTMSKSCEVEHLSIVATTEVLAVDDEAKVIRGFVVAQAGPFKTTGRGEFDERSLRSILRLMKSDPDGLQSFWGHSTEANREQLGRLLGRAREPRIETIKVRRNGEKLETQAVLADLYLDPTAFLTPSGDLGSYLMKLAKSDPRSFASSLTLDAAKEHRLMRGRAVLDEQGNPLPPLWRPLELQSIDIVARGEAVDSFLPARLTPARAMECLSADPDATEETDDSADIAALIDLELIDG